jgi:hypothetical protein
MNREKLIAAMQATAEQPPRDVTIEGWGTLFVKELTVEQVDLQQQEPDESVDGKDRLRFARGAARLICDEKGELIFDATNKDHLELLAKQPWHRLKKVISVGGEENATSEKGSAAAKKA